MNIPEGILRNHPLLFGDWIISVLVTKIPLIGLFIADFDWALDLKILIPTNQNWRKRAELIVSLIGDRLFVVPYIQSLDSGFSPHFSEGFVLASLIAWSIKAIVLILMETLLISFLFRRGGNLYFSPPPPIVEAVNRIPGKIPSHSCQVHECRNAMRHLVTDFVKHFHSLLDLLYNGALIYRRCTAVYTTSTAQSQERAQRQIWRLSLTMRALLGQILRLTGKKSDIPYSVCIRRKTGNVHTWCASLLVLSLS